MSAYEPGLPKVSRVINCHEKLVKELDGKVVKTDYILELVQKGK